MVEITIVLVTVIVPEQRKVTVPPSLIANRKPSSVQKATCAARAAIGSMIQSESTVINKDARDGLAKARSRDLSVGMNDGFNLLLRDNLAKGKSFAPGEYS